MMSIHDSQWYHWLDINVYDFEFQLHFLYKRDLYISTTEELSEFYNI